MAAMSDGDIAACHPNNDEEAKEIERILSKVDSTTFEEGDWNDVVTETKSLAAEWEEITIYLGLSSNDIKCIKSDCVGCYKCWSEALDQWIKQNYNTKKYGLPSWRTLLKAIARVDKRRFKILSERHQAMHKEKVAQVHSESFDKGCTCTINNQRLSDTTSTKDCLIFPFLKGEEVNESQIYLELFSETQEMRKKFKDFFKATEESLVTTGVSVKSLLKQLDCLGSDEPALKRSSSPELGCRMSKLRQEKNVKDVMSVIDSYCSFFNYHIIEEIINNLGTEQDKQNLETYEKEFTEYAQHNIKVCSSKLGELIETGQANMFVILDKMHESYNISHLCEFITKVKKVLKINGPLRLCRIGLGSLKMIFQLPHSLQQAIFPLSSEQEEALSDLGVVLLSCGDYQFPRHEVEDPVTIAIDGDSDHRDTDNKDSVITNSSYTSSDNELAHLDQGDTPSMHVTKHNGSFSVSDLGLGTSITTQSVTNSRKTLSLITKADVLYQQIEDPNLIGIGHGKRETGYSDENELHYASRRGDLEKVKRLVEEKRLNPLEKVGKDGMNALHYAAEGGDLDVMKYFVEEKGYNPARQDSEGLTCLHYAARNNHFNLVQYFVGIQKIDPMCEGSTPLHSACVGGSASIVEYLVNAMTEYLPIEEVVKCKGKKGWSPLHFAAFYGKFEIIILLITKFNADPLMADDDNRIALHGAAQQGYLEIVKFIVEHNCNPSHADKANMTPLHFAAWKGHLDIVKYLTQEQRCDPSCPTASQQTPLHGAAWNGHLDVVKYLTLELGCDPLCKTKRNLTPYHWAARKGQLDIVKFYIENLRCPPDFKGGRNNKRTSLDMARDEKHHEVVKYLKSIRRNPKK